jgi:Bacterial Ig-like domain (group 3)
LNAMVLLGNSDGTFQSPLNLALQPLVPGPPRSEPPSVVVEDFNLDGKRDLIFSNGQLALGNGDGTFVLSSPLFPLQVEENPAEYIAFPLVQISLSGNPVPSLVYLLPTVIPPAASVFTPLPSSSATLSVTSLGAGAHTITAHYSGDTNYATDTSTALAVTVSQATSATVVTSSANPSFAGQSVTLTASVASTGPTPTGNMIFTSGSTTLGTVALSGGSAAYTTTSLTSAGTQTITAAYSGDANTQASSGTINQVVNAAFTPAPASGSGATLIVKSGQAVSTSISVAGAAGFSGQVALACSGLPAGASCTFTPATVGVSGTTPATSSLTVNTGASTAAALAVQDLGTGFHEVAYGFTFGSFLVLGAMRGRRKNIWALFGCLLLLCSLGLTACGGNSAPSGTAPGTYNFTVTATSGLLKASNSYTLNVQ